jgi:outer membrane receptor for Fe3+-dicitrate
MCHIGPTDPTFAPLFVISLIKDYGANTTLHGLLLLVAGFSTQAQDMAEDTIPRVYDMPQIQVVQVRDGLFARTPGSVTYLSSARLRKLAPLSGNEVFRTIPGVHVNDEEGAGLRMNLGIRGLDPDRSRGVLVLEDGLPVALTPYGEPEMYYTPAIERMSGVELVKGSGQILFGPKPLAACSITLPPIRQPRARVSCGCRPGRVA